MNDFDALVQKYQNLVLSLIQRTYGGHLAHQKEDLAQEVWIKLWDALKKNEKNIVSFKSYLYRTVQTTMWDAMQRLERMPVEPLEDLPEEPDQEPLLGKMSLEKLLESLSKDEQVMLKAWSNGFSYDDIAHLMKCSEGRVRNIISRAKKKLREDT